MDLSAFPDITNEELHRLLVAIRSTRPPSLQPLTTVKLDGCHRISADPTVRVIASCLPEISSLRMQNCTAVADDGWESAHRMRSLIALNLSGMLLTASRFWSCVLQSCFAVSLSEHAVPFLVRIVQGTSADSLRLTW